MSKFKDLFNYMRTCPELADLWSIGGKGNDGESVIIPFGSSEPAALDENIDVLGNYSCVFEPYPSVYEEYHINCFRMYENTVNDSPDVNVNIMQIDKVQNVIDWINRQNEERNLPVITGKRVVSIECRPQVPQVRYIDEAAGVIAYFITLRVRYVNTMQRFEVEYGACD